MVKYIVISVLIIGFCSFSNGQSDSSKHSANYKVDGVAWKYFKLKDTMRVKVIDHFNSRGICGMASFASMTIIRSNDNELIRLLDLCGTQIKVKKGAEITIAPAKTPDFSVLLPSDVKRDDVKTGNNPTDYDHSVTLTTWCVIISD